MLSLLLAKGDGTIWMPPQASTVAGATDYVFYYILYISAAFFILINGAMFYFIWKYRRRGPHDKVGRITHSTPLEIGWSVIPGLLLIPMFWWGFKGYMEQRTFPPNCLEINVVAAKWNWTFIYSNSFTSNELHVPVDTPVRLIMRSNDVIHSCFIPAFRVKRDVVPGRYADLWFRATRTGRFPLVCAEYCGTSHSDMKADVYVHPKVADGQAKDPLDKSYDEWLKNADPYGKLTPEQYAEYTKDYEAFKTKYGGDEVMKPIVEKLAAPPERGQQLWDKKGCKSCHTLDGTPSQGPSWKGVFGKEEALADGTKAKVDENYLRESILEPNAKIVAGFARGVMPKTPLKDYEIDALIAFFKSLSGDQK